MQHKNKECNEYECYCLTTDTYPTPDPMCDCGNPAWHCVCFIDEESQSEKETLVPLTW